MTHDNIKIEENRRERATFPLSVLEVLELPVKGGSDIEIQNGESPVLVGVVLFAMIRDRTLGKG